MKRSKWRAPLLALLVLTLVFGLFTVLFRYDNKYTRSQPEGNGGVLELTQADLEQPLFLISGWLLSVDGGPETETFIGQYSNFSFAPGRTSPFGRGTYRLTLKLKGPARTVTMELPEIFTEYVLQVNGESVADHTSGTAVSFYLDGATELLLETENNSHYYSGLYYPPALGTEGQISRLQFTRNLFYGIVTISALTLFFFSTAIWLRGQRDLLMFHLAVLCAAFAVSCLHPFLWQLGINGTAWYCVEDTARLLMWVEAGTVAAIAAELWHIRWIRRRLYPLMLGLTASCFVAVRFVIPLAPGFIHFYGAMMDTLTLCCWLALAVVTGVGLANPACQTASLFSLAGSCTLGAALCSNLLDNNMFEPIYTGWQGEWAGFLMVVIFAALGNWRNAQLLKENDELTHHLEEQVEKRTNELNSVIEERKSFFSEMAHNLKAPIAAIHGFISLIRSGSVGVDDELLGYISLIETENMEMRRRVQALNELNAYDRLGGEKKKIGINRLLAQVEALNRPETEAAGIQLTVGRLDDEVTIMAHQDKLLTLFENLIFNAISFTPMDGGITIHPERLANGVQITVADTGSGIPQEQLPHVFDRFFVGRKDKNEGSGLGLYIAKLTMEELGGTITARSEPGEGAAFDLYFPVEGP